MKLTRQSKMRYWSALMGEWESSGETQIAFCERKGIKLPNFTHWRQLLKRNENRDIEDKNAPHFVEATLVENLPNQLDEKNHFLLTLSNGTILSLPLNCTTSQLQAVFSALELI